MSINNLIDNNYNLLKQIINESGFIDNTMINRLEGGYNKNHIILMGDSVLDNFYWLKDKKNDLRQQLENMLPKAIVTNVAVDETTTEDILYGKNPRLEYSKERKKVGLKPYLVDKKGYVKPLILLKKMKNNINLPTYVVLSVGGNDARILLHYLDEKDGGKKIWDEMKKDKFQEKYEKIVKELLKNDVKIILVIVYYPQNTTFLGIDFKKNRNKLKDLMENVSKFIFKVAKTNNLPVINLSKTFNPDDKTHYGSSPIEPSNKSSMFISTLIKKVVQDFDFDANISKSYYKLYNKNKIQSKNN